MDLAGLLVLGLATWRIASLLVNEDGLWEVLGRFRCFVGVRWDEQSRPCPKNELAKLLSCVWCTSVWVGLALAVPYMLWPVPTLWISSPFALSALAVLVDKVVGTPPD